MVADIEQGADTEAFACSTAASPGNRGYSYHHQWWVTHNAYGAYHALGYGGQILYIAPGADLVVAKFSSYPTPTPLHCIWHQAYQEAKLISGPSDWIPFDTLYFC